jgi:hypothetical protein
LPVRALIYDRTCAWHGGALSHAWAAGSRLHRALGRIDAARGVASWDEALGWLAERQAPIDEVQYWGHGKWSCAADPSVIAAKTSQNWIHTPLR